jgi:hypothetical protein
MKVLDKDLRSALEKTVKAARIVSETAAHAALEQLGVGHDKPESFLTDPEKALRNRLRTHGKQLGDARDSKSTNPTYGKQELSHLVQEVAYEHWHRMLFARFLADNNLLMFDGVAVTIEECDELAPDEGAKSGWELAAKLAARMLPQVFKPGSPVFELTLAPEHQSELERLLQGLSKNIFEATDSLGWVYQFWQTDNKERINKSEVKIGADELPAVTQLFTEPYMVAFLLHNSLGAWWATRYPGKQCPVDLEYFRALDDGTPAAGKFEGWPDSLSEFKLLDPCCGSGHFLVAAFLMLVPMRVVAEGLSAKDAVSRVLAENLHGLEIDPRCVEIAVFAVALEAWRYPDASGKALGVREIPTPNIACCGLKVAAKAKDWEALVPDDATNVAHLRLGLNRLHETFTQAPLLGSLLDPSKADAGDLFAADYSLLTELLSKALATERKSNLFDDEDDRWELALSAQGLLEAARLLDRRYNLVITNVPYISRGKQVDALKDYCEKYYPDEKHDLANVFLERCLELCFNGGVIQVVIPQNWLFLGRYKNQRRKLLTERTINFLIRLGAGAFETITGEVVNVILLALTCGKPLRETFFQGIDVTNTRITHEKARQLQEFSILSCKQSDQLSNPDAVISLEDLSSDNLLSNFATALSGCSAGDAPRFNRYFWEVPHKNDGVWRFHQGTVSVTKNFGGQSEIIFWENEIGSMYELTQSVKHLNHAAQNWLRGKPNWGKPGVVVSQMGDLPVTLYTGEIYDCNACAVIPNNSEHLSAFWAFCESGSYAQAVRKIDQSLKVTPHNLLKVSFDIDYWTLVANKKYPNGLPKPYSDDPTQWIFHGHPQPSIDPLQVAVVRLLGYTWPAETDNKIELSEIAQEWIARSQSLLAHADKDGIVCIPPVGQEASASDRLVSLLAAAYGDAWSNDVLAKLLSTAGHAGKSLETWLREKFFTQHYKCFGNRPFVWHIWDGLSDGFSALVNYHKLDSKKLESLIYTYLGDWIGRQKRDADNGVDGAQEKLAAAELLKKRLELILAGEAPYDIFIRWKPLEKQPVGWNPDLNDGVRLNIRPFLSVPEVGKRGAGVLRDKPNIKWDKDRGSDVASAPWYQLGLQYDGKVGDRINDHHLSLTDKLNALEKVK